MNAFTGKWHFGRTWCLFLLFLACGMVWATDTKPPVAAASENSGTAGKDSASTKDAWENHWFLKWGPADVHAELKESESEIDKQLNHPFSLLIPDWSKPRTFKDLSNDFELRDMHLAVGRDINPKWSWYVDVGGILGEVKNKENYMLPLPLNVKLDFGRKVWFVAVGVDYYPWGKPVFERDPTRNAILDALRSSRPFFEGTIGHVDAHESAKARFQLQHTSLALTQEQNIHHAVEYISPRIGVETPLGKNDSFILEVGYLFFDHHPSDFNNLSIYFLHSHRF